MKGKKDCKIIWINFNQVSVCTAVLVCLEFMLTLNYMLTEFKITELFIISIANQINAHRIEAIRVAPPSKKDANESCFQSTVPLNISVLFFHILRFLTVNIVLFFESISWASTHPHTRHTPRKVHTQHSNWPHPLSTTFGFFHTQGALQRRCYTHYLLP